MINTPLTLNILLKELQSYTQSPDEDLVRAAVQAIGRCSGCTPDASVKCLHVLLNLIEDRNSVAVSEAIVVIKQLLQSPAPGQDITPYLKHLLYSYHNSIELHPEAKAAIIWLIGQYADLIEDYTADVLRVATKDFKFSTDSVKAQCLSLGAKLVSRWPEKVLLNNLFTHMLSVARYDTSFDLRDRARFLQGAYQLSTISKAESLKLLQKEEKVQIPIRIIGHNLKNIFCEPKPAPVYTSQAQDRSRFSLGSASLQLNHQVRGYTSLPDWPESPLDGSARKVLDISKFSDTTYEKSPAQECVYNPEKTTTEASDLDAFYAGEFVVLYYANSTEDESSDSVSYSESGSSLASDSTGSELDSEESQTETDEDNSIQEQQPIIKANYNQL